MDNLRYFIRTLLPVFFGIIVISCSSSQDQQVSDENTSDSTVVDSSKIQPPSPTPAANVSRFQDLFEGQRVAVVVNQTSRTEDQHLVDALKDENVDVVKIFAPEHGFRGEADAGEKINSSVDSKTGLPIISLYGSHKKPTAEDLEGVDMVIYDIQDVGCRFYTYISTMHYVMEACAENGKDLTILDRPNPNGYYVAGPVLDLKYQSFVGMHPIPVVYGLTAGELAMMINGEGWLKDSLKCKLEVIKCENYKHSDKYSLPVKPSPNLPNDLSVKAYPSLCYFEPTVVSIGRGTTYPFQVMGLPDFNDSSNFCFTPISIEGMSKYPKHQDKIVCGTDLREEEKVPTFTFRFLLDYYKKYGEKSSFFTNRQMFNLLAGNDKIIKMIERGKTEKQIFASYEKELRDFMILRRKYLLYPEQ